MNLPTLSLQSVVLGLAMIVGFSAARGHGAVPLVPAGSVWKYLDDGSDQSRQWIEPDFEDTSWKRGPAPLGYGDGDEATVVSFGPDSSARYITTYFRHAFTLTHAGEVRELTLRLLRDDGAVVYLNGREVHRDNMPPGSINHRTLAFIAGGDENIFHPPVTVPASLLVAGANVLAVEIHQASPVSTDVSFDLELTALYDVAPRPFVNVVVQDPQAAEPLQDVEDEAVDTAQFQISRSGSIRDPLEVHYVLGGSAVNGDDYARLAGSVTIPAGAEWVNIEVLPLPDALHENVETVVLELAPPPLSPDSKPYQIGTPARATVEIVDSVVTPNLPPEVRIVEPSDGATFIAPGNLLLSADCRDPDGTHLPYIEFHANGELLGRAADPAPGSGGRWLLQWLNVAAGRYAFTAVATDDRGAKATSAPVHVTITSSPNDRELHVVGVYSGRGRDGNAVSGQARAPALVSVDRPGKQVSLLLSGYEPVEWRVTVAAGTKIERVFLSGYYRQTVTGLPEGVPVIAKSYETHLDDHIVTGWSLDTGRYYQSLPKICELTGQDIASLQGDYTASAQPYRVVLVGEDPRLRCGYPQPVPASEVPALNFRLAFFQQGQGVSFQDYNISGPQGGGELLPGFRVVTDGTGQTYYGADPHFILRADRQTGAGQEIQLPSSLPEVSWPMSAAFDTRRSRVLIATLGGEGFLYSLSRETEQWTATSLRNLDLDAIAYHTASDTLFGVSTSSPDGPGPMLHEIDLQGRLRRSWPLPPLPWYVGAGPVASELESVGEHLLWLMGPRSSLQPVESRMYLINPRTGQARLTYRKPEPRANRPPFVEIVSPSPDARVTDRAVVFEARAVDPDGEVASVEFFLNGVRIGTGTAEGLDSYRLSWKLSRQGPHVLTAVATDDDGAQSSSAHRAFEAVFPPPHGLRVGDLLNVNFGVGNKVGPAAIGSTSVDLWNLMGQAYNPDYSVAELRRMDGERTSVSARLQNSGGIWGNRSGDTMYDSYVYPNSAQGDGVGNMILTLSGIPAGTYNLVLYGHADHITPDNRPESDSVFSVQVDGHRYGPLGTLASPRWTVDQGWREGRQFVVFRGVRVPPTGDSMVVTVQPGYNGRAYTEGPHDRVAILNGLQLLRLDPESDADRDHVPDVNDLCNDTPPESIVDDRGCSIADFCPCDGEWRNHGEYVRCVIREAWRFFREDRVGAIYRRQTIQEAARSECGRPAGNRSEGMMVHVLPLTAEECHAEGVKLVFTGGDGGACVIETSTDLNKWIPVQTLNEPEPGMEIVCPHHSTDRMRYYRVRAL